MWLFIKQERKITCGRENNFGKKYPPVASHGTEESRSAISYRPGL
jgi:hypothetical protein